MTELSVVMSWAALSLVLWGASLVPSSAATGPSSVVEMRVGGSRLPEHSLCGLSSGLAALRRRLGGDKRLDRPNDIGPLETGTGLCQGTV